MCLEISKSSHSISHQWALSWGVKGTVTKFPEGVKSTQFAIKKISFDYKTTRGLSRRLRLCSQSQCEAARKACERQRANAGAWDGAPSQAWSISERAGRHQTACGRAQKHNLIQEAEQSRYSWQADTQPLTRLAAQQQQQQHWADYAPFSLKMHRYKHTTRFSSLNCIFCF